MNGLKKKINPGLLVSFLVLLISMLIVELVSKPSKWSLCGEDDCICGAFDPQADYCDCVLTYVGFWKLICSATCVKDGHVTTFEHQECTNNWGGDYWRPRSRWLY